MLAEEIGDALGVPATLSALRRTQAGVFSLAQCHTLPEILAAAESGELETNGWVLPIESVFAPLPPQAARLSAMTSVSSSARNFFILLSSLK